MMSHADSNSSDAKLPEKCDSHVLTSKNYYKHKGPIGFGMGGAVYAGVCRDQPAAIKLYWHQYQELLQQEIHFYEFITHFAKPPIDANYLLQYYGYENSCYFEKVPEGTTPPSAIVIELAEGGSLDIYFKKNSNKSLSISNKKVIIVDITKGINALHQYGIVHDDLKSANIFLKIESNLLRAKIGDFNTSKHRENKAIMPCTSAYAAPEVLLSENQDYQSDMYGFGIIVWEICANKLAGDAYEALGINFKKGCEMREYVAENKKRLAIPAQISEKMTSFIQQCWDPQPKLRPSSSECIEIANTLTEDDLQKLPKITRTPETLFYHQSSGDKNEFLHDEYQQWQNANNGCCNIL